MSRIAETFAGLKADHKKALIPYFTAGYPSVHVTIAAMHAAVQAGADLIELGIPFSDPMADGPTIQYASEEALKAGMTLPGVLKCVAEFRKSNANTPIVLMGYANPIESYERHHGAGQFAKAAAQSGVDGLLVVDLPPLEAEPLLQSLWQEGLDMIFLVAPTSTQEHVQKLAEIASGYVYYVSLKGVTGSAQSDWNSVADRLEKLRAMLPVPVCVGFGIRDAAGARALGPTSDGIIMGSRIIELMRGVDEVEAVKAVASFLVGIRETLDSPL